MTPASCQQSSRQALRQQRRQLSPRQQQLAAERFCSKLCSLPAFQFSKRIAFYQANDGELNPQLAAGIAQSAGKHCYLPVIHPLKLNRLHFVRHQPNGRMKRNRYDIAEPALNSRSQVPAWSLDIILVPLVGFDKNCHRIGMGGGYYDRSLAFKRRSKLRSKLRSNLRSKQRKPLLIGVAHQCQQLDSIDTNPWDIPLDMVITDQQVFYR